MLIGIVGKSNTGKTTFFSAATLVDAEISNRIFTTIKPNIGISYVRTVCPCKKFDVKCNPQNSKCIDGIRLVPVKLIDVAGLVPGAHEGRGLGNQFLSDIMEADALIHVVDASGGTDKDGNPVEVGSHDPLQDVKFLENEIDWWIFGILKKNWEKLIRRAKATGENIKSVIYKQLSGLKIDVNNVEDAVASVGLDFDSNDEKLFEFVNYLRKKAKPILVVANKMDIPESKENYKRMLMAGIDAVPCCAEAELALRRAEQAGIIDYIPGDDHFEIKKSISEKQRKALDFIANLLKEFGSAGVQQAINKAVFELLRMIVVYPVANISKLTDSKGNVLPDAYLVKNGTTLKDFASKVHTTMAEHFIGGLDINKKKLGADYRLKNNDVIEILFKK